MTSFESILTSSFVANIPAIKSIAELQQSSMSIYTDPIIYAILYSEKYDLPESFLARIQVRSTSPWSSPKIPRRAYIVSKINNKYFIPLSLQNQIDSNHKKFYLMNHIVATLPLNFLFPKYSPYQRIFQKYHDLVVEAGFKRF